MEKSFSIFLTCALLGIFILLLISLYIQPKEITRYSQLKENDYVKVTGKIISIRTIEDFSIIKIDKNITTICNCKFPVNQTILVQGTVEKYKNELQINADKIESVD